MTCSLMAVKYRAMSNSWWATPQHTLLQRARHCSSEKTLELIDSSATSVLLEVQHQTGRKGVCRIDLPADHPAWHHIGQLDSQQDQPGSGSCSGAPALLVTQFAQPHHRDLCPRES